jgi:hypothetical protein
MTTHGSLTPAERLELQQLLQIDLWSKRRVSESSSKRDSSSSTEKRAGLPERWELTRGINLHPWQQQCVDAWFNAGRRGVLKVVTGAGKTILALAIVEKLHQTTARDLRVAIIVPTIVLLDQWREEIAARSNLPPEAIGLLGAGFNELVVDECHRAGAAEMQRVLTTERVFSLGLSDSQVGQVLDQLLDPSLELHCANHSDLEAEVAQGTAQVVLDGDGLRLQQLAMGQQHAQFLTAQCLHMHRAIKPDPHHLCDAACIVAPRSRLAHSTEVSPARLSEWPVMFDVDLTVPVEAPGPPAAEVEDRA